MLSSIRTDMEKIRLSKVELSVGNKKMEVDIIITERGELILEGIENVKVSINGERLKFKELKNANGIDVLDDPWECLDNVIDNSDDEMTSESETSFSPNMNEEGRLIELSNYKRIYITGTLREYQDNYEYMLIDDYEEILPLCISHTMPIGNVVIHVLEPMDHVGVDDIFIVGIEFSKEDFDIQDVLNWLEENNITVPLYDKNGHYICNANKALDGLFFKGYPVILHEKGNKRIYCDISNYIEITEKFIPFKSLTNSRSSKVIKFNNSKDKQSIIYDGQKTYESNILYNGIEIDYIPVITFDLSKDLVISNGNVMICDYIAPFGSTLGFYEGIYDEEKDPLPISFIVDMDTIVNIKVEVRPTGGKFCNIEYNYIIQDELRNW